MGENVISQEEFRAAIESRFNLSLSEAQFENLVDRIPLDEDGNVKYAEFMTQFDTRLVKLCWIMFSVMLANGCIFT